MTMWCTVCASHLTCIAAQMYSLCHRVAFGWTGEAATSWSSLKLFTHAICDSYCMERKRIVDVNWVHSLAQQGNTGHMNNGGEQCFDKRVLFRARTQVHSHPVEEASDLQTTAGLHWPPSRSWRNSARPIVQNPSLIYCGGNLKKMTWPHLAPRERMARVSSHGLKMRAELLNREWKASAETVYPFSLGLHGDDIVNGFVMLGKINMSKKERRRNKTNIKAVHVQKNVMLINKLCILSLHQVVSQRRLQDSGNASFFFLLLWFFCIAHAAMQSSETVKNT